MELTIWCARAIKTVLAEVGAEFECSSGCKLNVVSDPGLQSAYIKRLQAGETFDVFVFPPGLIDTWIKEGKIVAETRTPIVRAGIGVAVRTGAPKPDVSTVDAFKRALLAANEAEDNNISIFSVSYNSPFNATQSAYMEALVRGYGAFYETIDSADLPGIMYDIATNVPVALVE